MGKALRAGTFVESFAAISSGKHRPSQAKGAAPENRATKDACLEKLTGSPRQASLMEIWRGTRNTGAEGVSLQRAGAEEVSLQSDCAERAWQRQATCRGHRRGARDCDATERHGFGLDAAGQGAS